MFSEYSLGVSNFVLKFRLMAGSAFFSSNSSPLASLTSLSFSIIKFLVWVSATPTPRTKIVIDVPVDDAGSKLSGGISSGLSVAVQPKRGSFVFTCFSADTSICWMLCSSSLSLLSPRIHSSVLKFVFPPFCLALLQIYFLFWCGVVFLRVVLAVVDDLPFIIGYPFAHTQ